MKSESDSESTEGDRPQSNGMKRKRDTSDNVETKMARLHTDSGKSAEQVPDNPVNSGKGIYYDINEEVMSSKDHQSYRIMLYSAIQSNTTLQQILDYARNDILDILHRKINRAAEQFQVTMEIGGCTKYCWDIHAEATKLIKFNDDIKVRFVELEIETQQNFNNSYGNEEYIEFHYLSLHLIKYDFQDKQFIAPIKGVVNIVCPATDSFMYSVLAGINPGADTTVDRLDEHCDDLNMNGISLPVLIQNIPRIESQNDFSINVFTLTGSNATGKLTGPVYHTKNRKEKHVNLLYVVKENSYRYFLIRDLNLACKDKLICDGCLNSFNTIETLDRHKNMDCLRVETKLMRNETKFINKKNIDDKLPVVVYADFEALVKPINQSKSLEKDGNYRKIIKEHVPVGYAYYVKFADVKKDPIIKSYIDSEGKNDCMVHFFDSLKHNLSKIYAEYKTRDLFIPIFFHNLTNYDGNFIMREIDKYFESVRVLGSLNSYLAIFAETKPQLKLRFLDTLKFLSDKLETLIKDTSKFSEIWRLCDKEGFELLRNKGIIPFDYIQSFEDLQRDSLPQRAYFYSQLGDSAISQENYRRVRRTWNHFQCNTIADYLELYVKTDVLLLADVFENIRSLSLKHYKLDPANYFSLSGLSWDAMLYKTDVILEPILDVDMLLFIEHSIGAGVTHCSKRHAIANNEDMGVYDKNGDTSYIMYYDANNLYGYAMSLPLPYGKFQWLKTEDYDQVEKVLQLLDQLRDNSSEGYILEVDLAYPTELHDPHADFPFCPEKKTLPHCGSTTFRVTDFAAKKKYVIHHSYLKLCIQQGLILEKVHRILKFKQKPWLKSYIDFNTKLRENAKSNSAKNFFKQMNNNIYGRSILNSRKFTKIEINEAHSNPLINPNYIAHTICSENRIAVSFKNTVTFKMPKYVGFCILELAKTHMYNFHYNVMKNRFGKRITLLYTDTDSLIYQINSSNFFGEVRPVLEQYFDTDNYDKYNEFDFPRLNDKRLGYFKDEMAGILIKEFVALKPKMYALQLDNGKTFKKAIGVVEYIRDRFTFDDYKECLYSGAGNVIEYDRFINIGLKIYTERVRKAGLSSEYRHRYVMSNKVDTLPWFHYNIPEDAYFEKSHFPKQERDSGKGEMLHQC